MSRKLNDLVKHYLTCTKNIDLVRERLLSKVLWNLIPATTTCWIRNSGLDNGYSRISVAGVQVFAHVVSYIIFKGFSKPGNFIHHTCEVRCCINPEHLIEITRESHVSLHHLGFSKNRSKSCREN